MRAYTVNEIAKMAGGKLLAGDGNRIITEFCTNSKEGGEMSMFVPVIGEHVDAHDFIKDAYGNGVRATFTCRKTPEEQTDGMAYIYIDNPDEKNPNVAALQRVGAYVRGTFPIPVVGITGSVGKTTTKEMVAAALQTKLCTLKTAGNMNSQIGLPLMMCRLEDSHEIAVIEMGMSMAGEMEKIVRVARPECAVVTNIGVSHIGQLGSKENIRKEKLNIINEFPESGVLFLNGDDPMLLALAQAKRDGKEAACCGVELDEKTRERFASVRIVTFGTGACCDYRAKDIRTEGEETYFTLCEKERKLPVRLSVLGAHNVLNALAAIAVAEHYGIDAADAAKGLYAYRPIAMRGGKIVTGGMTLIDDTYNASPDSMRGGIDILMETKAKRHIAVLADMLELGVVSKECHEQVGAYAAQRSVDYLVAVGEEAQYYISASTGVESRLFQDNAAALEFLKTLVQPGDAVLFKGSRGMKLEQLVAGLQE